MCVIAVPVGTDSPVELPIFVWGSLVGVSLGTQINRAAGLDKWQGHEAMPPFGRASPRPPGVAVSSILASLNSRRADAARRPASGQSGDSIVLREKHPESAQRMVDRLERFERAHVDVVDGRALQDDVAQVRARPQDGAWRPVETSRPAAMRYATSPNWRPSPWRSRTQTIQSTGNPARGRGYDVPRAKPVRKRHNARAYCSGAVVIPSCAWPSRRPSATSGSTVASASVT